VRLYSRHGAEYTDRLPGMVEAFAKLPTHAAILDGELCLIDPRGSAHFYRLMAPMRTSHPDGTHTIYRTREGVPRPRSYSLTTPA
jgi:ATP-dependent DNA ligase